MRARWLPFLCCIPLASACWFGEPYESIQFCIDSAVSPETEDGRLVYHHSGELVSDAWNDEAQDPIGPCGVEGSGEPLPEWIFRIRDLTGRETRFGYTIPELERPIDKDEDDLVTIHAVYDGETFGFLIYGGECPDPAAGDCLVEMAADDGLGGRVIGDELMAPYTVARGESLGQRNGVCGKVEYYPIEVKGGSQGVSLDPGSFTEFPGHSGQEDWDAFAVNVDNHTWTVDSCGDAQDRFSYVVMRND